MSSVRRGADRRTHAGDIVFPLRTVKGDVIEHERRVSPDRRRNAFISRQSLFRGLPYDSVEPIFEHCRVRDLDPGDVLLELGQSNRHLYLLLSGRLQVNLNGVVNLDSADSPLGFSIEPGESIGEMSIIDGKPTSAHVGAAEPSRVVAIHEDIFWSKIATIPGAVRNLMRMLVERMRKRNDFTLQMLEKELRYKHMQNELNAAREIQLGMLPTQYPLFPRHPSIDVYAHMNAAKTVGGDFFDAFPLDERRVCLAIGDVSGKGMPAALSMVRILTLLRVELMKGGSLGESLARLNKILCETNTGQMFVSIFVGVMDAATGELAYVNAGHNPPLASIRRQPFERIKMPSGLIAGVIEDSAYEVEHLTLGPGDLLVMYTDGVTEARNEAKEFYTLQRLMDFLSALERKGATDVVDAVRTEVDKFIGVAAQADDMTIMALKFCGSDK